MLGDDSVTRRRLGGFVVRLAVYKSCARATQILDSDQKYSIRSGVPRVHFTPSWHGSRVLVNETVSNKSARESDTVLGYLHRARQNGILPQQQILAAMALRRMRVHDYREGKSQRNEQGCQVPLMVSVYYYSCPPIVVTFFLHVCEDLTMHTHAFVRLHSPQGGAQFLWAKRQLKRNVPPLVRPSVLILPIVATMQHFRLLTLATVCAYRRTTAVHDKTYNTVYWCIFLVYLRLSVTRDRILASSFRGRHARTNTSPRGTVVLVQEFKQQPLRLQIRRVAARCRHWDVSRTSIPNV